MTDIIFTGTNFSCTLADLRAVVKVSINEIGLMYADTEPITHMTPRRDKDYEALIDAWKAYKSSIS